MLVPQAPADKLIQTVVIGAPNVLKHDGESLTAEWVATVGRVVITNTDQLSAVCTDGQYHHNGVPDKFSRQLGGCELMARWDDGHLLEPGCTKAAQKSTWVQQTVETITSVTKLYRSGKGLTILKGGAVSLGIKVLDPALWSDTRWSTYAANVIHTFLNNMPVYARMLDSVRSSGPLGSESTILDNFRDNYDDCRTRVQALFDIYSGVGKASRSLQNLQLPWERQATFASLPETLETMARCVRPGAERGDKPSSSCLSSRDISILLEDDEDDCEVWPVMSSSSCRLSQTQARDIGEFTLALAHSCTQRVRGIDSKGRLKGCSNATIIDSMPEVRLLSDLQRISTSVESRADTIVRMKRSFDQLIRVGLLPKSLFLDDRCFSCAIDWLRADGLANETNQVLFKRLWEHSKGNQPLESYVRLVSRLWLCSPSESVVESMASVLKYVFGENRKLEHQNAVKELIIRWNGPPSHKADKMIDRVIANNRFQFIRATTLQPSLVMMRKDSEFSMYNCIVD